jgi:hypothetical protein
VRLNRSALGIWFLLAVGLLAGRVWAAPMTFDLPVQPADSALLAFSRQAGVELLFSSAELHQVRSTAVSGSYEPVTALSHLLRDTGFSARSNGRGKFVVAPIRPPTGSLRGRLLTADGTAARGVQVTISDPPLTAVTNVRGDFVFGALRPGTYRLTATGPGYQPLQITDARVAAGRAETLETQTMHPAGAPRAVRSGRPFGPLAALRPGPGDPRPDGGHGQSRPPPHRGRRVALCDLRPRPDRAQRRGESQ